MESKVYVLGKKRKNKKKKRKNSLEMAPFQENTVRKCCKVSEFNTNFIFPSHLLER